MGEHRRFWDLLKDPLHKGMVYMGASAGAIVAGQTIKTAYWKGGDSPGGTHWEGWKEWTASRLVGGGLIDVDIFPHFQPGVHESLVETYSKDHEFEVQVCSNTMALVH